jgi:hypothetical protein
MSVVSTTPRVESVSNPALAAIALSGALAIGGLLASVLREAVRSSGSWQLRGADSATPDLLPVASARRIAGERVKAVPSMAKVLDPVEAEKASSLRLLSVTPCFAGAGTVPYIKALVDASSIEQVRAARTALVDNVERTHQRIVVDALTVACRRAANSTGFETTDVRHVPGGLVRITSRDADGRGVVTEIDARPSGEIGLASEVVNGQGTCHELIAAYERALDDEGVRRSLPDRRDTGGVCQLFPARALAEKLGVKAAVTGSNRTSGADTSRRRQLNDRVSRRRQTGRSGR